MSTPSATRYRYSGPLSGMTLGDGAEIMLVPGSIVTLPRDNPYVAVLQARRHLTEVPQAAPVSDISTQEDE